MVSQFLCISAVLVLSSMVVAKDSEIITEPRPGEEYVFVQSYSSGAHPITRKNKAKIAPTQATVAQQDQFESSHKIPSTLTFKTTEVGKSLFSKKASPFRKTKREVVDPPPRAIKIDPSKLIEKYRTILESSTAEYNAKDVTTPSPILTTGAPSTERSFEIVSVNKEQQTSGLQGRAVDAPLSASGTENKNSRIQIKKGPNGQDYEYEYVYYYYDDDDVNSTTGKNKEKISNAHDGPQRNSITPPSFPAKGNKNKYSNIDRSGVSTSAAPEQASNEVLPTSKTRQRGRQLSTTEEVEQIDEERLPSNTRFPPRERKLTTTPIPAKEEEQRTRTRHRGSGRPSHQDNIADESQGATSQGATNNQNSVRSRSRSNVRRPSLELVDSASFKTHASDVSVSQYKDLPSRDEGDQLGPNFPTNLPEGPMKFLGATTNEAQISDKSDVNEEDTTGSLDNQDATTEGLPTTVSDEMTSAMDKVALDLYAILQGTQNMMNPEGDETDSSTDENSTIETSTFTTELTTEEITTVTTTTSTTTPATTTTTTTEPTTTAATGRNRFRGRGTSTNRFRAGLSTSSTTEASVESSTKAKGRFSPGKTSFGGRTRINPRTTTESSAGGEPEASKEEAKPISHSRPTLSRSRFGSRSRPQSTTSSPSSDSASEVNSNPPSTVSRSPSLVRPRPNFNLRRRGPSSTTEAAHSSESDENLETKESEENVEISPSSTTTSRPGRIRPINNVRPLRPGPKIDIRPRGRLGSTSTTAAPEHAASDSDETVSESTHEESGEGSKDTEASPLPTSSENPLTRLRNRARLTINPAKPKTPATPLPVARRTNPLLSRRKPNAETTTEAHETKEENVDEASTETNDTTEGPADEANEQLSSSTTEAEPRGLNGLLAGRRRLVARKPGTIL